MGAILCCARVANGADEHRPAGPPDTDRTASFDLISSGGRQRDPIKFDKKLQKLIEYSGAHPEEISGIGAYLLQHLNRDLDRASYTRVEVAVNIMDLLLESCRRTPSWKLLVQNYLEMVKRLLMTDEPKLETMGTNLFSRHANVHKYAHNLSRDYNFLSNKFMEFSSLDKPEFKRLNGFNGLKVICLNLLHFKEAWTGEQLAKVINFFLTEVLDPHVQSESRTDDQPVDEEELSFVDSEVDFFDLFVVLLCELTFRSSADKLRLILGCIFKHFTVASVWHSPRDFASGFFMPILAEAGDHKMDIFLQALIRHIQLVQKSASNQDLVGMADALANFATLAAAQRPDRPTKAGKEEKHQRIHKDMFMSVMELIQGSTELQKCREDRQMVGEYQDKLLEAMAKLSSVMPDSVRLEAVIATGSPLPIMVADKPFFSSPPPPIHA